VGDDRDVDGFSGKADLEGQVGFREPVAVEVPAVDDAGYGAAAGCFVDLEVFNLGFENEAVHGVAFCAGLGADVVGGEGDGMALPLSGEGFTVSGELAADAVWVGEEEGRAEPVAEVAVRRVLVVEHLGGLFEAGRGEYVDFTLAGEEGGDLLDLESATGEQSDGGELGLSGVGCRLAGEGYGGQAVDGDGLGVAGEGRGAGEKSESGEGVRCELHVFVPWMLLHGGGEGVSPERNHLMTRGGVCAFPHHSLHR